MARSYANVITAIWRDSEFRALRASQQRTYLMLVTQPNISAAGTLPLTLVRWAGLADDTTADGLRTDLAGLEERRFVVVDETTEELLVRSFVRHDNGYRNPKRTPAIREAAVDAVSPAVRRALAAEFSRLGLPASWLPDEPPDPTDRHTDSQSNGGNRRHTERERPPEDAQPVDNPEPQVNSLSGSQPDRHADWNRVVVTQGPYVGPQPSTHNPHPAPRRALTKPARAVVEALGCDDDDGQWIADEVHRRHRPRNLAGYLRRMAEAGDLAPLLAERHQHHAGAPVAVVDPPCGQCGPNRLVELADGRAARCPTCHPLRSGAVA
jgi:hypothetical protein